MDPEKEKKYLCFRPAWKSFGAYILGFLVFGLGPRINPQAPISPALSQLLATLFLAFILIKRFTNQYLLEPDRLVWQRSFPSSFEKEALIREITRIDLRRGISQRLAGVAHVHIYVRDESEPLLKLFGVPEPDEFKALLLKRGAGDQRITGAWRK